MEKTPWSPERVTLTYYDRAAERFGLSWYTAAAGSPAIRCAVGGGDVTRGTIVPCTVSEGLQGFQNTGVLSLPPETDCVYQVGDAAAGVWSAPAPLRRRVPAGGSFTFLFMSDTQDGEYRGAMWARALSEALRAYPEAAFLIHGGDIVDTGCDAAQWRDMLAFGAPWTRSLPMLPASGNHSYWDCYLSGEDRIEARHFHIDLPPQDTRHGLYYLVEYGDCLFLVMNSGDVVEPGAAMTPQQLAWVEAELAATTKPWRLAMIHNPLYSPGKYGSRPDRNLEARNLRAQLNGLFARYQVQLCMCGHDHVYMRTHPVDGDGRPGAEGTVHFMPGCAGIQCRPPEELSASEAAVFAEYFGTRHRQASFAAVEVSPHRLTVRYHTVDCAAPTAPTVPERTFVIER